MRSFCLCIFILGSCFVSAQNTDSASTPIRKNQLFTNLLPVLVPAFGAVPEQFAFRLGYERSLKKNWYLRGVGSMILNNGNPSDYFDYNVLAYTDSLMTREYSIYLTKPEYRLGIGMRKSFPMKRLIWYTGADLYAAYSENGIQAYASFWRLDSASTGASSEPTWVPTGETPAITRLAETVNYDIGISPFFGAEIPLRKRFSLSLQTGFDYFYRSSTFKEIFPATATEYWRSSNFNMTGLVNELALRFRF